jgi:hypothetical protein
MQVLSAHRSATVGEEVHAEDVEVDPDHRLLADLQASESVSRGFANERDPLGLDALATEIGKRG